MKNYKINLGENIMYEEMNGKILKLSETRVWRTYTGGKTIDVWHGKIKGEISNFPEDWVASTVRASNPGREDIMEGYSTVRNISGYPLLKEVLEEQKENYFGKKHLEKYGSELGMLIKLIDSAERLTIQTHPDKQYAKEVFQSEFGKTEAWFILDAIEIDGEKPCVYFGFKPHVTREIWKEIFETQDIPAMLDCLHKIPVKKGDSFFIPGGLPHAIGKGCFLAEVQEPTDFTMRTELITPGGLKIHENQCHQGVGYEKMLYCFHYEGDTLEKICESWKITPNIEQDDKNGKISSYVDSRYTDLFQMKVIDVKEEISVTPTGQFKIWLIFSGSGKFILGNDEISLEQGEFCLLPASLEQGTLVASDLCIIECLPKKV